MVSSKQLKKEIADLKKKNSEQAIMIRERNRVLMARKKEIMEKRALEKELKALKNPKSTAFKRNLKRAGRLGFKAVLLVGEDIDTRARSRIRKKRGK